MKLNSYALVQKVYGSENKGYAMFDFSNRLILEMADCLIQNFQKAVLRKISLLQKKVEHGVKDSTGY
jgi:hypothetical protein